MTGIEHHKTVFLGAGNLSIEEVVGVARHGWKVAHVAPSDSNKLQNDIFARIIQSRNWVEHAVESNHQKILNGEEPEAYYGINTGFGAKSGREGLPEEDIPWVSHNLLVSHCAGSGDLLDIEVIRAAMLVRANSLALGYSGVRPEIINIIVDMLNKGVVPLVPEYGSVGASGDLAPLAYLGLILSKRPTNRPELKNLPDDYYQESGRAYILLNEGENSSYQVKSQGGFRYVEMTGEEAMAYRRIERIELKAKEGLAINNGATFSAALAALAVYDAENLVDHAEICAALSLEALLGFRDAFLPHIQTVRRHSGQKVSAENVLRIISGSSLVDGDLDKDPRFVPPQDPYSIRVTPQVVGGVRDGLEYIRRVISDEINAATDNPLIFDLPENDPLHLPRKYRSVSGGNFHGAPIAYAMDFLGILITDLGSLSERRTFRLTVPHLNGGLPPFLLPEEKPGVTSGLMIPQYLAAGLVSDCKTLAHPDSVDSIPTSASQEDHVSMSMNAARHARRIVSNIETVISVELLCASLAIFWRVEGLKEKIVDPEFCPKAKKPYQRDRVDEIVLYLRDCNREPKPGYRAEEITASVFRQLFSDPNALPELRQQTLEDRFLEPYINRTRSLLISRKLTEIRDSKLSPEKLTTK
ncbi:MAG: aromatic amino acid lyase [Anaerolineales bacterium]|nr:aromatic amino acid lyase [Anaerolineales bacterium]